MPWKSAGWPKHRDRPLGGDLVRETIVAVNAQEILRLDADNDRRAQLLLGRAFRDYNLMVYAAPDDKYRRSGLVT